MTNEEGESSQNVSAAIKRLARLGPKVIDGRCNLNYADLPELSSEE
jgi:hypothetical protein